MLVQVFGMSSLLYLSSATVWNLFMRGEKIILTGAPKAAVL
jgi:hypothetical protein